MEYVYTNHPIEVTAEALTSSIIDHLDADKKVLLLLSGGSNIPIAIKAFQELKKRTLSKLSVTLTDERFGPTGHENENWQQLLNAGLDLNNALFYRPLINKNIKQTTHEFNNWLKKQFNEADYVIGIFGVGADGHTAGIKPFSPAVKSKDLATSFKGDDYDRVTISFNAIRRVNEVFIQASGQDKSKVLRDLLTDNLSLTQQPAQILKEIPKLTIVSNNKEEEL